MYLEFPAVYRFFREYIEAAGGIFELKKALDWSVWYAVKWWRELVNAGAHRIQNTFVKALYNALLTRGIIDEEGGVRRDVKKPEMPKGIYAREWVEMHQNFDSIDVVKVARDEVDRNVLDLFYSDLQIQGWHRIMIKTFFKAVGMRNDGAVLEPYSREGLLAVLYFEDYKPRLYVGYDSSPSLVELAKKTAPEGTFVTANSACDVSGRFDVVLLVEKMQWFPDPARELECIWRAMAPGGRLYVAQPVVESMPGYLAIHAALGAIHVYSWKDVENLLQMHFKLERRLIKTMPFYGAVWKREES